MAPGDSKDDSMSKNGDENSSDNGSNSMASNTSRPHQSSGGWGVPETALSDLSNDMFDDSFIDESLFSSWATDDEGMQHALYGPIDFGNNAGPACEFSVPRRFFFGIVGQLMLVAPAAATANTTDLAFSTLNVPHGHPGLLSPADSTLATAVDQASDSELCGALQPASTNPCSKVSFKLDGCSCLLRLISVLEKLAVKSASRVDRIDLLLADVRYSIGTLAEIVSCASCVAQAERNTLLAIATQRISVICGKMAICLQCLHGACPATSSSNLLSPGEIDETSAEEGNVDMSISSYRVTQRERLHLLRSLVAFQIEEFEKQFQLIKSCSHRLPSREQATALAEAEDRIILARAAVSGSLLPTIQGRD